MPQDSPPELFECAVDMLHNENVRQKIIKYHHEVKNSHEEYVRNFVNDPFCETLLFCHRCLVEVSPHGETEGEGRERNTRLLSGIWNIVENINFDWEPAMHQYSAMISILKRLLHPTDDKWRSQYLHYIVFGMLSYMTHGHPKNAEALYKAEKCHLVACQTIMDWTPDDCTETRHAATIFLLNLVNVPETRAEIYKSGVVDALLQSGDETATISGLRILRHLVKDNAENCACMLEKSRECVSGLDRLFSIPSKSNSLIEDYGRPVCLKQALLLWSLRFFATIENTPKFEAFKPSHDFLISRIKTNQSLYRYNLRRRN